MMTQASTFDFFGDPLEVMWDGNVWVSPSNGQQHSRIGHAVRTECEFYLRSFGQTPEYFADEIDAAIEAAAAN